MHGSHTACKLHAYSMHVVPLLKLFQLPQNAPQRSELGLLAIAMQFFVYSYIAIAIMIFQTTRFVKPLIVS